jgi:DNA-directed RNA polymerase specialized sigma24 family protein
MDAELYARLVAHARRVCPADPAIEPEDLVQAAWLRTQSLRDAEPGRDHGGVLYRAVTQVAIEHYRRGKARGARVELGDWHPAPGGVEALALARVELGAILADVAAGDLFALAALTAARCGNGEAAALLGWERSTLNTRVFRWRRAHTEA